MTPVIVLPDLAYHLGSLDGYSLTKQLARVQLTDAGELRTIEEPFTLDMVSIMLRELAAMQAPWLRESTTKLIRNEARLQMTNENQASAPCALPCLTPSTAHRAAPQSCTPRRLRPCPARALIYACCVPLRAPRVHAQENLRNARATLHGLDFARFNALVHGWEPLGDREGTLIKYFKDADEVRSLWPAGCPNGWIIPEKPPDAAGRKRPRLERHCGAMVIEVHADEDGKGTNKATYCTVRAAHCPRAGAAHTPRAIPPRPALTQPPRHTRAAPCEIYRTCSRIAAPGRACARRSARSSTSTSASASTVPTSSTSMAPRRRRVARATRRAPSTTS